MSWREIPLTRGRVALVDAADHEDLARFTWCFDGKYASRQVTLPDGRKVKEYMHRRLLPDAPQVDHINRNRLDNRRANLRPATRAENMRNLNGPHADSDSGFRGVSWSKYHRKWRARIQIPATQGNGREQHLGYFDTAEDAARAFDAAAIEHYGEFAGRLNCTDEVGAA